MDCIICHAEFIPIKSGQVQGDMLMVFRHYQTRFNARIKITVNV